MRPFTFLAAVQDVVDGPTLAATARRIESMGYDGLVIPDHLIPQLSPVPAMTAIADVELGRTASLPFEISRDAAEDVFRTVVTERRVDRARNPGLDTAQLDAVVPACCVLVGLMRRLRLDRVRIVTTPADDDGTP